MYNAIYHRDIVQGTDEWHTIRAGRIGGSEADVLLVDGKGGGLGVGAKTLAYKNMAQKHFPEDYQEKAYQSDAMQRGNELEMEARLVYEELSNSFVEEVGYISFGDYFGYSPDGLADNEGLIEIKCPLPAEILRYCNSGEIDKSHIAQMQWGMMITGAKWCDYVMYHPQMEFISCRIIRVEDMIAKFRANMEHYVKFCNSIESYINFIKT
jgi:hypothetical protein